MHEIYPGVWKITLGEPETVTTVSQRHIPPAEEALHQLSSVIAPFVETAITGEKTHRGYQVTIPLGETEQVYGLGLQLRSFNQRNKKKTLRVNSDPIADLGDSHAPVPFYATTGGYGVLVDTTRYATFYIAASQPRLDRRHEVQGSGTENVSASSAEQLYATQGSGNRSQVIVEIPFEAGATIYLFGGPDMRMAIQRYNLFSGGGCLPARWGLGVWYRCRADFTQDEVVAKGRQFREEGIPCDVLGLEPHWQSRSYSCTFVWNTQKYPQPKAMIDTLAKDHYRVNLWTHAFTHPESPIYADLLPYSGSYEVFSKGLVPDFSVLEARALFGDFYAKTHVDLGVSGYKLDECDNSDFIGKPWSFPEITRFPSGLDGEQMHSLFGRLYQDTIYPIFRQRDQRTYNEVRSAHALAAPYPFVLYSDLYDHKDFLRGVVNCGFSGLLWCPEVRHATSDEELIRRIQSVVFSPQALINAWYIKHAPWKQWKTEDNNEDRLLENYEQLEAICRSFFELRMRFIPYLYAAFFRYAQAGIPPFRALVVDYPHDEQVWNIDNQYLMGDRVMVAPVVAGETARAIYLPEGNWVDFWTNERYTGKQTIQYDVPLERIPVFVKDGSILPLAQPTLHTDDPQSYQLTALVYGDGALSAQLVEDDGVTYAYENGAYTTVDLSWQSGQGQLARIGTADTPRYTVTEWQQV